MPSGLLWHRTDDSAARVASVRWYVALWALLGLLSLAIVLVENLPVALPNPVLAASVATLAAGVGLALLQLGLLRFNIFGQLLDLHVGLAFGTLALANLVVRILALATERETAHLETHLALLLLTRSVATALFLLGLIRAETVLGPEARTRAALWLAGLVAAVVGVGAAGILAAGSRLPLAVDAAARQLLSGDEAVVDVLRGQAGWLLAANGALSLAMFGAMVGYLVLAQRRREPHLDALALALSLLAFSQLHSLLFPPMAVDYVSTADAFRLAAYGVLLFSLVARIGGEVAERAAQEERLRLSRELHDGLAQQLSLLNLRLRQATTAERPAERRSRDLEAATRVAEAALLEARQAIRALRSGAITWSELTATLETFAEEFASNHEVEVELSVAGSAAAVEAGLQVDLLRIVQEACSNALRHGAARRIEIRLNARPGRLELQVRDDGRGLVDGVEPNGRGVGLTSLRERLERRGGWLKLESPPGQGLTLLAEVPLPGPPGVGA